MKEGEREEREGAESKMKRNEKKERDTQNEFLPGAQVVLAADDPPAALRRRVTTTTIHPQV